MKRLLRFGSRGDTIIEVMVALTIIGAVVSAAYVLASRNLTATQQSQERGEAVKVAEGQIEKLKSVAAANPALSTTTTNGFCVLDDLTIDNLSATPDPASQSVDNDPLTGYDKCLTGTGNRYHYEIIFSDPSGVGTFNIYVRWFRLGGGKDEVHLTYRIV